MTCVLQSFHSFTATRITRHPPLSNRTYGGQREDNEMNETIEQGDCVKCMNRDVVAAGSPFLHGLLYAYQSPIPNRKEPEGS